METFNTPILFLIFNRPECTTQTFDAIRKVKPKELYIAADGPREGKTGEKELCEKTKDVVKNIDWDCEVKTLFREKNLGCGLAVSGAITWFFENVDRGIILEDDCVPNESFFNFCQELLEKYKSDEQIMHISGTNLQLSEVTDASYFFTYACYMWGWATWRRAWMKYDFQVKDYSKKWDFNGFVTDKFEKKYWHKLFDKVKRGKIDTWDYQWFYACWKNNGLSIMPSVNLVKNIGFGYTGTHTLGDHFVEDLKTLPLETIIHPVTITRNIKADKWHADILSLRDMGPVSRIVRLMDVIKDRFRPNLLFKVYAIYCI